MKIKLPTHVPISGTAKVKRICEYAMEHTRTNPDGTIIDGVGGSILRIGHGSTVELMQRQRYGPTTELLWRYTDEEGKAWWGWSLPGELEEADSHGQG